jgi:hypothetical protein
MPSKPALSTSAVRNFRPPVCEPNDGNHLRRLFPGVTLSRQARADLREAALDVLDEPGASLNDRIEAFLVLEWMSWSRLVAAGHINRSFYYWLKEHIDGGDAFLLDEDRSASNAIRAALGLTPLRVSRKAVAA